MEKPGISPAFTVEDIRKVRTYYDSLYATLTDEERRADIARRAAPVREKMLEARRRAEEKASATM